MLQPLPLDPGPVQHCLIAGRARFSPRRGECRWSRGGRRSWRGHRGKVPVSYTYLSLSRELT